MVIKIVNDKDLVTLKKYQAIYGIDEIVIERVEEIMKVLDDAYGKGRCEDSQGGVIMLFTCLDDYIKKEASIMKKYHLLVSDYEYSDIIGAEEKCNLGWTERLYLRSSEDALIVLYANK